jgi:hypothetical protein
MVPKCQDEKPIKHPSPNSTWETMGSGCIATIWHRVYQDWHLSWPDDSSLCTCTQHTRPSTLVVGINDCPTRIPIWRNHARQHARPKKHSSREGIPIVLPAAHLSNRSCNIHKASIRKCTVGFLLRFSATFPPSCPKQWNDAKIESSTKERKKNKWDWHFHIASSVRRVFFKVDNSS